MFDTEIEQESLQHEALVADVKRALARDEFRLFYQPKVSLINGDVVGFEALIRWEHPTKGLLAPYAFLPDVEKHSVMIEIDNWVIRKALSQMQDWHREGICMPVSVNLSHMFFRQKCQTQFLKEELQKYPDIFARMLSFEILESQALHNVREVASMLTECQKLGVGFALDDFGTGFSSLTYLKQLPIDLLKVDRSFVMNMHEDEEDRSILKGIMALCVAFDINAIAEGVETLRHGAELKRIGLSLCPRIWNFTSPARLRC